MAETSVSAEMKKQKEAMEREKKLALEQKMIQDRVDSKTA